MKSCLVLLITLLFVQPLHAWNKNGHAAIAAIAEDNLTPEARKQVRELLQDDLDANNRPSGRTTLPEIASWPDEIRRIDKSNRYVGWHTHGNSVCTGKLGTCWLNHCVDKNLLRYIDVLKNKRANHRRRNEALKWIVHLTGDMHQPLHSWSNRDSAGNVAAALEGRPITSLHWIWDIDLLDAALNEGPVTAKLETAEKLPPYRLAVMMWLLETRDVSLEHAYMPLPGFRCGTDFAGPYILDSAYQEQAKKTIRQQIARAGLRLAQLLNELLR